MQTNGNDVSHQDIIESINNFANKVEQRFQGIERTMTTLVTRDYLDDKLADLRGDLVVLTRKEDSKLRELVGLLRHKNVLDDADVKHLITMEPFPQWSV